MLKGPKLIPRQWKLLASASSNIAQAIILFSLATIFVPEAVSLPNDFYRPIGLMYFTAGFLILASSVIISKKEGK